LSSLKNKASLSRITEEFPRVIPSLGAIGLGFFVTGVLLFFFGYNPIQAYATLFEGAFSDIYSVCSTLNQATPLIFTGLAIVVAFSANVSNLGGEGQMYLGAFFAFLMGYGVSLPPVIHIPLTLLAGALGGALWSLPPIFLKAWGINEIVTTLMMNEIATLLTSYLTIYFFLEPTALMPETYRIKDTAVLPTMLPRTSLSWALVVGLACVAIVYYIVSRTSLGYKIRAVGLSPKAAEYGGISVKRTWVIAMLLSGALAGLAGSGITMGLYGRFIPGFSPGYGFKGIVVALTGLVTPIGALFAAIFFGAIRSGSISMRLTTGIPKEIGGAMEGLILVFVSIAYIIEKYYARKETGTGGERAGG